MANALYEKGREGFLNGSVSWGSDDIRVILLDLNDYAKLVSAATNASPIVVTTSTSHGLSTGNRVAISSVLGNTAANGNWTVTVTSATVFSLDGSTGNGAWTSGGFVVDLTNNDFLDDVAGAARVATSGALANKTVTNGVADADDVTFTSVTGDVSEALLIYKHTGTESTSRLLVHIDTGTGLPVTPNGGNITVTWSSGTTRIFKL